MEACHIAYKYWMYSKDQAKAMRKYDDTADHDQAIKVIYNVYPDVINNEKCLQQYKQSITETVALPTAAGSNAEDPMVVDDASPTAENTA